MKTRAVIRLIQGISGGALVLMGLSAPFRMILGVGPFGIKGLIAPALLGGLVGAIMAYLLLKGEEKNAELIATNERLSREIAERKLMEDELLETHDELEMRVRERTSELFRANEDLKTEIAERKQAQDQLSESEERYRSLVESANEAIISADIAGRIISWNAGAEALFGWTEEEAMGQPLPFFLPQRYLGRYRENLEGLRSSGGAPFQGKRVEFELTDKSGREFPVGVSVATWKARGKLFFTLIIRDITERKRAEEALRESEERFRFLSEQSLLPILMVRDNKLSFVNQAASDLLGYSVDEMLRWERDEYLRAIHPDDRSTALDLARGNRGGDPEVLTKYGFRLVTKKEEIRWVDLYARATSLDGKRAGLVTLLDRTEQKKAQELVVQSERLKAVGELASGVAHNFNNLLQIVMGGAQLVLNNLNLGKIPQAKLNAERIIESSRLGAETVLRLQSFANIRSDVSELKDRVFDLSGVVSQAVEMTRPWWKTNPERDGLTISLDLDLKQGCFIRGKENELFEVIVNLIKNSAEALPEGGSICVNTLIREKQVILAVKDTGVGINKENLGKLFEPFWSTKGLTGTGMGLAASYGIISRHGGAISVESVEGHGSTFTVGIPFVEDRPPVAGRPRGTAFDMKLTILIIDDMPPVADMLKEALSDYGQTVLTAESGHKGLRLFAENQVDLVICDLGMPGMNGWEIGKTIQAIGREKGLVGVPFIMVTGWGGQHWEESKIAESGVDRILEKPIDVARLLDVIGEVVEGRPA